jgi:hypothetical protein
MWWNPMGTFLIEVFICSHDRYVDVSLYREMSHHIDCGLAQWAYDQLSEKFEGRMLSQEDLTVLEKVLEMAKARNEKARVYDVSRIADRVRALKRGVLKTPTVIINGERYEGLKEVSQAILGKSGL